MRFTRQEIHDDIYVLGLMFFVASIPLSNYCMSLAQWMLAANFLIDPQIIAKFKRLWKNRAALIVIGIFVLHLIGLLWSSDLEYALKDIRVKLPILILPIILAGEGPLNEKKFRLVMFTHAVAVVAGSIVITYRMYFLGYTDPRMASSLISHIRFALNLCVAIFALFYFLFKNNELKWPYRLICGLVLCWFMVFLLILQSLSGMVIFAITGFILLLRELLMNRKRYIKIIIGNGLFIGFSLALTLVLVIYFKNFRSEIIDYAKLEYFTPRGNKYIHNPKNLQKENGNYLWQYVCNEELQEAWEKRSSIPFEGLDHSGQQLKYTLIRFLTSKGYRKDLDGVNRLTQEEITAIENGIANINELENPGFLRRVENVIWEFNDYFYVGDPNQRSLMQRVELWKAGLFIITDHPLYGVGTGDVLMAFNDKLTEMNSALKNSELRSHNQYLAMAVAFGLPGLLYFIFALIYPPMRGRRFNNYFFLSFMIIGLLSMFPEDTLESQAGVSFFMFFFTLTLFGYQPEGKSLPTASS